MVLLSYSNFESSARIKPFVGRGKVTELEKSSKMHATKQNINI